MYRVFAVLAVLVPFGAMAEDSPRPPPFAAFEAASEAVLNDPHDLAFGPDGLLYIADKFGNRVVVMDPESLAIVEVIGDGAFPNVHDVDFGPAGRMGVAVTGLGLVAVLDRTEAGWKPVVGLPASRTEGALMHSNGMVYAMSGGTGTLIAYEGETPVASAGGMLGAHDVAEAPDGTIWVADNFNRRLVQFAPDLSPIKVLDGPQFGFPGPRYMDIDAFGRLIVADQDAHRILMIDPQAERVIGVLGTGVPGLGPGLFDDPEGVAVDDGRFFFADSDNNRIVRYVVVVN